MRQHRMKGEKWRNVILKSCLFLPELDESSEKNVIFDLIALLRHVRRFLCRFHQPGHGTKQESLLSTDRWLITDLSSPPWSPISIPVTEWNFVRALLIIEWMQYIFQYVKEQTYYYECILLDIRLFMLLCWKTHNTKHLNIHWPTSGFYIHGNDEIMKGLIWWAWCKVGRFIKYYSCTVFEPLLRTWWMALYRTSEETASFTMLGVAFQSKWIWMVPDYFSSKTSSLMYLTSESMLSYKQLI